MNIGDYYNRNVPEYYPYMYLDGYTPDQIMYAHHKMMRKQIEEHIQKKQQKQQKGSACISVPKYLLHALNVCSAAK